MTRNEVYNIIRPNVFQYVQLQKAKKRGYICPVCGSGSGNNGTGIIQSTQYPERFKCFACGTTFDIFDLYAEQNNMNSREAFDAIIRQAGIEYRGKDSFGNPRYEYSVNAPRRDQQTIPPKPSNDTTAEKPPKKTVKHDYSAFYEECHRMLLDGEKGKAGRDYLEKRGIAHWAIDAYNLGYCPNWRHSKAPKSVPTTRRIIVPRSKYVYLARRIDEPADSTEADYVKQIEGEEGEEERSLFVYKTDPNTSSFTGVFFVVEGEFDTISLVQAGAENVIGLCALNGAKRFLDIAKKRPEYSYIILTDNDTAGKKAQTDIESKLESEGLTFKHFDIAETFCGYKDANSAWTSPEQDNFVFNIAQIQRIAADQRQKGTV